jgi:hypothetical protein
MKKIYILVLFSLVLCACSKPISTSCFTANTSAVTFQNPTILIPQVGSTSCWAASLLMASNDQSIVGINNPNTPRKYFDEIVNFKPSDSADSLKDPKMLSWEKIKAHLTNNGPFVFYKYYESQYAHVAVVHGFEEIGAQKYLLYHDPWPVNQGISSVISFEYFKKPIFYNLPEEFPRLKLNGVWDATFNFISQKGLIDNTLTYSEQACGYNLENLNTQSNTMPPVNTQTLVQTQNENLSENKILAAVSLATSDFIKNSDSMSPSTRKYLGFNTDFNKDSLVFDKTSIMVTKMSRDDILLNAQDKPGNLIIKNPVAIIDKTDKDYYLFDGSRNYFQAITAKHSGEKIVLNFETDNRAYVLNKTKQIYLTRIEPYKNSKLELIDQLQAQSNQLVSKLANTSSQKAKGPAAAIWAEESMDPISEISDVLFKESSRGYLLFFKLQKKELVADIFQHSTTAKPLTSLGKIKIYAAGDIK